MVRTASANAIAETASTAPISESDRARIRVGTIDADATAIAALLGGRITPTRSADGGPRKASCGAKHAPYDAELERMPLVVIFMCLVAVIPLTFVVIERIKTRRIATAFRLVGARLGLEVGGPAPALTMSGVLRGVDDEHREARDRAAVCVPCV